MSNQSSRFLRTISRVTALFLAASPAACFGLQATLTADAHVSSARPTINSGALSNLAVGNGYTTLLHFDLGALPAGTSAAQISRAVLRVYCNRADTPGTVTVQALSSSWSESSVTYDTAPSAGAVVSSGPVLAPAQFIAFDVTAEVQAWVNNPASNYGVSLSSASAALQFDSKENDQTAHAPQLEIALAAGGTPGATGPAGPQGPVGPTGAAGPQGLTGLTGPAGAQGAKGDPGAQGIAGPAGPQGPAGLPGNAVAGPQGPTGPQGPMGPAGLTYQGTYASTTNYALGDVVIFRGSSYVSLMAANHGNTPDQSVANWGLLTSQGPAGIQGLTGAAGPVGQAGPIGPIGPPGERGDQGPQGIPGQAGAQGIPGAPGSQGLQGPAGPQGAAGPVGLAFQGQYSSTKNYGVGDGVLWQGAGWVSLSASNHGNTPDQSPAYWAMFAAAGTPGTNGAVGPQGPAGAAGANGAQGATGMQGPAGPAGAAGTPGLTFQGPYRSTTNYALGDVVFWNGSSYASLAATNHGNTPDASPAAWGVLTAQGGVGPVGPQGVPGVAGPQGVAGPAGPAGTKGDSGATGIQGPAGAQGLQGPKGAAGDRGETGPQGPAGQAGAQGIPGAIGAAGPQGPMGPQGVAGPTGLAFKGSYDSQANYSIGDGVLWQGSGWVSLAASNHGNTPDQSPTFWSQFATAGATGANGARGTDGAPGPAGPQGLPGATGPAGPAGATGAVGKAGLVFQGSYASTTNYALGDVVFFNGASYASLTEANHGNTPGTSPTSWGLLATQGGAGPVGPKGEAGDAGVQGPPGLTGPQGPVGQTGIAGPQGIQGPAGLQGLKGDKGEIGAQGVTGATGPAGQAGAQGIPGVAGEPGPQGPAGPQGVAGPVGLTFKGPYSSSTNYAAGDGVLWQGAGWVSLVPSNHGNTPDQSPSSWLMFSAPGAKGATGEAGPVGAAGPAGANGLPGQTGATGSIGPQGMQGPVGPAGPTGSPGAPGIQGPAGAQGLTGAPGPAGERGAIGPQGPAGQPGAQGIPGIAGDQGLQGPIGPQGPAGPTGLTFKGAYDAATNYTIGDGVFWQGSGWVSLITENHGNSPDQSPAAWQQFAAAGSPGANGVRGSDGAMGPVGPQGPVGPAGPTGSTGSPGATGRPGLVFRGAYVAAENYTLGDVVFFDGASYASLIDVNHGNAPGSSPASWGLLAMQGGTGSAGPKGDAGAVGPQGAVGLTGASGPQGIAGPAGPQGPAGAQGVRGDKGETGAQGATGPIGPAGQAGAQGVAGSAGPQGPQGATGEQGLPGAVGLTFRGNYDSSANYAAGDGVLWQGAGWVSLLAGNHGNTPDQSPASWKMFAAAGVAGAPGASGPAGPTGAAGPTGPQGLPGTVGAVGPQGPVGASGPQGAQGPVGPAGIQGPAGLPGATGAAGPTGDVGPAGPQGLPGQAGAQGPTGPAGPTGAVGPLGPQGPAGPTGLVFRGAYNSSTNYGLGDGVYWQGSGWVSLTASNLGNTPDQSPSSWAQFAAAGTPGATGAPGAPGQNGAQGAMGPAGQVGLVFKGPFDANALYGVGDGVLWQGAGYVSLTGTNRGNAPDQSPTFWLMFAASGAKGEQGLIGNAGPVGAQGPTGPQGPTGSTGPQGAVGPVGPAGPTGPTGLTGLQGPAGPQGLKGDTGTAGPQGAIGPQGVAGQPGAQGVAGAKGDAGLQGPAGAVGATGPAGNTGATGPAGPVGLNFRGAWQASAHYAARDAVAFGGGTYYAEIDSTNQQPDLSATSWAVLALPGSAGVAGPTGPAGPTGSTGAQGIAGAPGAPGATGSTGPAGPAGAVGMTFRGAWAPTSSYNARDVVTLAGSAYIAQGDNTGQSPDVSTNYWNLLARAGDQGAVGPIGNAGPVGPQGPAGPTGIQGPQGPAGEPGAQGSAGAAGAAGATGPAGPQGSAGPAGLNFRGAWSSGAHYTGRDAVIFGGSTYFAEADSTNAQPDQSPTSWALMTQAGAPGVAGSAGAAGPQGVQGLPGQTGPQGPAGPAGAAGPTGAPGAAGATGAAGSTGPQGAPGPVGLNFRAAWASGAHYTTRDVVTYGGGTYYAQADNTNQEPDTTPSFWAVLAQVGSQGPTGANGDAGASATVIVNSVTTLPAGSTPTVTNSGTAQNVKLDFGLPQASTSGDGGTSAASSTANNFMSMMHYTNNAKTIMSVSTSTVATAEGPVDFSGFTWVPRACTVAKLDVYTSNLTSTSVSLRVGALSANPSVALTCSFQGTHSCSVAGPYSIPAGSFIDLILNGASNVMTNVWTSLECDPQ